MSELSSRYTWSSSISQISCSLLETSSRLASESSPRTKPSTCLHRLLGFHGSVKVHTLRRKRENLEEHLDSSAQAAR
ncbi:uncharacterized protein L3040_002826 [Drepanopeziza brunnea f. sp. 'multigermtubi']|uniref:uncharacterized protein n=1 Tax=Drepanopeziza brunnea f. sp. 'multigermtubi' TaxID=698441 RepID=UPI0023A6F53F|nr:hypothetical protein L3040_002826 [Drepanopeziza brunnea f. sp. 'multigermtubi']